MMFQPAQYGRQVEGGEIKNQLHSQQLNCHLSTQTAQKDTSLTYPCCPNRRTQPDYSQPQTRRDESTYQEVPHRCSTSTSSYLSHTKRAAKECACCAVPAIAGSYPERVSRNRPVVEEPCRYDERRRLCCVESPGCA